MKNKKSEVKRMHHGLAFISYALAAMAGILFVGGIAVLKGGR